MLLRWKVLEQESKQGQAMIRLGVRVNISYNIFEKVTICSLDGAFHDEFAFHTPK